MPAAPLLSVIVVCKNPGPRLRAALASVWTQREIELELIVIDGGSSDGSREWLESERPRLASFVSEPDGGIYDAMNKGVQLARGEWLLFLGADDRLVDEAVLHHAFKSIQAMDASVAVGEAAYEDGRIYRLGAPVRPLARNFVHHQGSFYRRALFATHGGFDRSLAIMGDYDFNLRLWKTGVAFKAIPSRIAACGIAGSSDAGSWRGYAEEIKVRHRHFSAWRCVFWDGISLVRYVRKKIVRSFARH